MGAVVKGCPLTQEAESKRVMKMGLEKHQVGSGIPQGALHFLLFLQKAMIS